MADTGCLLEEIRVLKAECELLLRIVESVDEEEERTSNVEGEFPFRVAPIVGSFGMY